MARNGKIACLPREIREQVNRRLEDGQSGKDFLDWLNGLPEVKTILDQKFAGQPISKQNLCEWRAGGYLVWQAGQEMLSQAREMAADAGELVAATQGRLTDHLATVLAARYAATLMGWNGDATEEFNGKLRVLRGLCQDIAELRRGDHSGARLELEKERLDREQEKTEEELAEQFQQWAENPAMRECLCKDYLSPEERKRRFFQIFNLEPETPQEEAAEEPETSPVKPGQSQSNPVKPKKGRSQTQDRKSPEELRQCYRRIFGIVDPPEAATQEDSESKPVEPSQTHSNQIQPGPAAFPNGPPRAGSHTGDCNEATQ